MTGIYFSGTGNTKHCVEKFVRCFDSHHRVFSIETPELDQMLAGETVIVFGYPVYFSNIPKMVSDFIKCHAQLFSRKKVFIIATMGLFSGDGSGCSARLLKKHGAEIIGGLHVRMPDCIADNKLLKYTLEKNRSLIRRADRKICFAAERLKESNPPREGLSFMHRAAGLLGQRLWFYGETHSYKQKPAINRQKCGMCGLCIKGCPMNNLAEKDGKLIHHRRCTMCYRCVSHCPAQALTVLGKRVYEQYYFEKHKRVVRRPAAGFAT